MGDALMTKLDKALERITLLGFDTSPFIYFVERHPVYLDITREIIRRVDVGVFLGYSFVITLTEVLVQPKKFKDAALENDYRTLLQHSRNFELVLVDEGVAEQAADLRSRYTIRTPDALQISAALSAGCQTFVTNDKRLKSIVELKILVLDELLP